MKSAVRILTIALACFAATTAWAQDVEEAYKKYKSLRDDRTIRPSLIQNERLCEAGVEFLAKHAGDARKARDVVNTMLSYGINILGRHEALRAEWFARLNYATIEKQYSADEKSKVAFVALRAAVAEGVAGNNITAEDAREWYEYIETLKRTPNSQTFILDRERGFYNAISRRQATWAQKLIDEQIEACAKSKSRDVATWAGRELKLKNLRETVEAPITFTALNGKEFDSTKLKGNPKVYVYFWSSGIRNAAYDLERLMDIHFETSRRQIEFVLYVCDPESKRAEAEALIRKAKCKCPIYFDGKGARGELYQRLGGGSLTTGLVFESTGKLIASDVRLYQVGKFARK